MRWDHITQTLPKLPLIRSEATIWKQFQKVTSTIVCTQKYKQLVSQPGKLGDLNVVHTKYEQLNKLYVLATMEAISQKTSED